jgi:hypothetical protein
MAVSVLCTKMQKPFWFLLFDSSTRQPCKGLNADAVLIPHGAVLLQFRDAVKAKYADSLLRGVAPASLVVYKDRSTFDGNEEPLEEDTLLDGLGKTMKDALIVIYSGSSFPRSRVLFYNSISDVDENDGWISFDHMIPFISLNKMYIRNCYRTIASSIFKTGINKAIITGTPGIGKSIFLIYLLWKLVKEGKRVLFIYHPFNIYYDGKGGVFRFSNSRWPPDGDDSFWNDTLWCLFDAKFKNETHLGDLPVETCSFVLATSPRRQMVNDFKKPPVPQVFYMPTWTEDEVEAIAPLFPSANEWRSRLKILGGIPRHVLEVTTHNPIVMLKSACYDLSLDDCIKKIGMNSEIAEKSKGIHFLIHMTSTDPFTDLTVRYASQTALHIIVRHFGSEVELRMPELLSSCDMNPLTAALCRYIFELYHIEDINKSIVLMPYL